MEKFLTLKLYSHLTELFIKELFWHLTEFAELELFE